MRDHRVRVGPRYYVSLSNNSVVAPTRGIIVVFRTVANVPLRLIDFQFGHALIAGTIMERTISFSGFNTRTTVTAEPSATTMTQMTPVPVDSSGPAAQFAAWYGDIGSGAQGSGGDDFFYSQPLPFEEQFESLLPIRGEIIVPANGLGIFSISDAYLEMARSNWHYWDFTAVVEELR